MKTIKQVLLGGPLLVGEVRGAKAEVAKRFDKTDKNAPPLEFGLYKVNLELLGDGAQTMLTVFLDATIKPDEFAAKTHLKRGDIIAVAVSKLELKNGVRRAVCRPEGLFVLDKSEIAELRS